MDTTELVLSRRTFAVSAGSAAVGMMAAMTQQATGAASAPATTQATSVPTTSPTATDIDRVAWLEKSLGRQLSPQMRDLVAREFHQNDQAWVSARRYSVPDGTEPAFVFTPEIHVAPVGSTTAPTTREADDER
jgi:hypothetical protein